MPLPFDVYASGTFTRRMRRIDASDSVVVVALAGSYVLSRWSLDRHRLAEWERLLGSVVDGAGGRYPSER